MTDSISHQPTGTLSSPLLQGTDQAVNRGRLTHDELQRTSGSNVDFYAQEVTRQLLALGHDLHKPLDVSALEPDMQQALQTIRSERGLAGGLTGRETLAELTGVDFLDQQKLQQAADGAGSSAGVPPGLLKPPTLKPAAQGQQTAPASDPLNPIPQHFKQAAVNAAQAHQDISEKKLQIGGKQYSPFDLACRFGGENPPRLEQVISGLAAKCAAEPEKMSMFISRQDAARLNELLAKTEPAPQDVADFQMLLKRSSNQLMQQLTAWAQTGLQQGQSAEQVGGTLKQILQQIADPADGSSVINRLFDKDSGLIAKLTAGQEPPAAAPAPDHEIELLRQDLKEKLPGLSEEKAAAAANFIAAEPGMTLDLYLAVSTMTAEFAAKMQNADFASGLNDSFTQTLPQLETLLGLEAGPQEFAQLGRAAAFAAKLNGDTVPLETAVRLNMQYARQLAAAGGSIDGASLELKEQLARFGSLSAFLNGFTGARIRQEGLEPKLVAVTADTLPPSELQQARGRLRALEFLHPNVQASILKFCERFKDLDADETLRFITQKLQHKQHQTGDQPLNLAAELEQLVPELEQQSTAETQAEPELKDSADSTEGVHHV